MLLWCWTLHVALARSCIVSGDLCRVGVLSVAVVMSSAVALTHATHYCVSATAEPITTATDRTPTLQRSPDTIHERASATRSVQHQSNTRTSYKTFISNATHKYRSLHPDRVLNTPLNTNNDRAQGS